MPINKNDQTTLLYQRRNNNNNKLTLNTFINFKQKIDLNFSLIAERKMKIKILDGIFIYSFIYIHNST